MIVIISELEKENGELYMPHGYLNILVFLRFSYKLRYTHVKFQQIRRWKNYERSKEELKVLLTLMC